MNQKQGNLLDLAYHHPYYSYSKEALGILELLGSEFFIEASGAFGFHLFRDTHLFNISFWVPDDGNPDINLVDIRRQADGLYEVDFLKAENGDESPIFQHSNVKPDELFNLFQEVTGLALSICPSQ